MSCGDNVLFSVGAATPTGWTQVERRGTGGQEGTVREKEKDKACGA
jgi:hypothetical protein